jgi:cellulose synthase/poly-beta-1,6-N-acetylglucosamine synthase-like glycosyltransferase
VGACAPVYRLAAARCGAYHPASVTPGATHPAAAAPDVKVSLVVPVRNEANTIQELVDSIAGQTRPPDEVVIVDGGSLDGTAARARAATRDDVTVRVIEAGPATPGRGRNVGIAAARHEWIALTDAGIRLDPRWLERLLEAALRNPSAGVVYGNYEPVIDSFLTRCASLAYVVPPEIHAEGLMRGPAIASCLVRKSAWSSAGGFPDLRAAEDLIFMEALAEKGVAAAWAPGALVRWRLAPTVGATYRRFELYSRHNVWAGRQRYWHYGVARQYVAAALVVVAALVAGPAWLLLLPLGLLARAVKSIWQRREGRGLAWALAPGPLAGVMALLLVLDAATFVGWLRARATRPPATRAANS